MLMNILIRTKNMQLCSHKFTPNNCKMYGNRRQNVLELIEKNDSRPPFKKDEVPSN